MPYGTELRSCRLCDHESAVGILRCPSCKAWHPHETNARVEQAEAAQRTWDRIGCSLFVTLGLLILLAALVR